MWQQTIINVDRGKSSKDSTGYKHDKRLGTVAVAADDVGGFFLFFFFFLGGDQLAMCTLPILLGKVDVLAEGKVSFKRHSDGYLDYAINLHLVVSRSSFVVYMMEVWHFWRKKMEEDALGIFWQVNWRKFSDVSEYFDRFHL